MDCRTARLYLDCLHDGPAVPTPSAPSDIQILQDLNEHLDRCPECQRKAEEWQHFDRRMFSSLMSSPVPPQLEDKILDAIAAEFSTKDALPDTSPQKPAQHTRSRTRVWIGASSLVAMVGLICGLSFMRPEYDVSQEFTGPTQILVKRFLKSGEEDWTHLDEFDGSFDLGNYQDELALLNLSPARGVDLGGGRAQDAAVFQFGLREWGGIVTVQPTQNFTGMPDAGFPVVQRQRPILQWRSADGKLTYLIFVHKGSVIDLANELFGRLT
ncbi:hypothetical protein SH668x_000657 [Planctomicrobium sp. SH668]|uniref:hypothetical protein n=1 Tax=Planctomicrobium sp. SH668 TaxID=3448126 RepID=UPI003F5BCABD